MKLYTVMEIKNKTFLISGGASGLGRATAKMVIAQGGNVIIVDINEEGGNAIQKELGTNALFIPTDITKEEEVQDAIKKGMGHFGSLGGLVNCAGIAPGERILGRKGVHRLASFAKTIEINLIGTFNLTRLVSAEIEKNEPEESGERGVIINTASVAAYDGQIGQAAYAASKGGVAAMTLPIARELARVGIRVMAIAPGIFETPMLAAMPEDVKDSLGKQVPFPSRLGRPDEFASLAKHIIENQMLNGEVIRLDGSIRMSAK